MGSKISKLISNEGCNVTISTSETSQFDYNMSFVNFSIPDDLLIDILSYVSAKDLIVNCSLVCKEWKSIIDGHSVWKLKCIRENKKIPAIVLQNIPIHFYEKIYIHNPYGRNLIENPCGEDRLAKWTVADQHGEQNDESTFAIENPPSGADPVPQEVGSQSCFATTYLLCVKYQIIDLLGIGISEEILQMKTTKLIVGEWFAARFDCASEYHLRVALLDELFSEYFDESQENVVDIFNYSYREDQWIGREWHKVTHTFENIGQARYVYFEHRGNDCQFWAGHYGSKMTGAFVKLVV